MQPSAERTSKATAEMVRAELGRLLASSVFTNSHRLSRFLQFVVERANEGRANELKEYAIGVEVFERESDFDPRIDPIVRVQAAKLRSKLMEYYNSEGRADTLVISIPKGGYAPAFRHAESALEIPRGQARTSLAVLPFVNMSSEPENEYFTDGLTEEVINALTSIPGLHVVARTSVFRFKGQQHDVREIGGQLNAGTILEGSVRKAGTQLRVTAQLISVKDGYHLWSHTFKRELRDVFSVQEEVSQAVREALAPHLGGGSAPGRPRYEPEPFAHDLYLKGRYAQARRIGGDVPQAIKFFEQSIAADGKYARAHSGLADAWILLAFWGIVRPHDAMPRAKAAAQRALELDDRLAEGYASLGAVQCSYEWNWDEGQRSIERGLELDPDSPIVNQAYATYVLGPRCRLEDAVSVLRRTISLDPYMPNPQASLTFLLGFTGKLEEAEQQHSETITTNPNYFYSHGVMSFAYFMNERLPEALAEAIKLFEAARGIPQVVSLLAVTHAANGNMGRTKELLSQLLAAQRERYIRAPDLASIYCALGERKQALAWLNAALEEKSMHLYFLPLDPRFRRLHSDPDFLTILDRVGLRLPAI